MNPVQEERHAAPMDMRHPAFRHDPHPLLRESTCVARHVLGIWLVLHHEDVNAVLRSSQLSREIWRSPGYGQMRPFLAGSFDLMTGLAQPLPVRIICDVLGLPHEDIAQTKARSDALSWIIEPVARREQLEAAGHETTTNLIGNGMLTLLRHPTELIACVPAWAMTLR